MLLPDPAVRTPSASDGTPANRRCHTDADALTRAVEHAKEGDRQACEEVLSSSRPMVARIARRFRGQGIAVEDLIQEGMVGVLHAIDRFDPAVGAHFLAYAAFYAREAISRAVAEQSRPARIPISVWKRASLMRATERELASSLGRMPTQQEVADALHLDANEVANINRALHHGVSFEAPLDEAGSGTLRETIADPGLADALEHLVAEAELAMLPDLLRAVSPRGRAILSLRYGLHGDEALTPGETADRLGLSRERVRQLEMEAIGRMRRAAGIQTETRRHPDSARHLRRRPEHAPVPLKLG
jgi:RNA polymerase sigma factor (sigma-70 family)